MATTRTVTIEAIEERTSQKGQRYWRVKVAGERQSLFVWDAGLAEALMPGCTYQVELNGSADYPRIADATLVPEAPVASTPPASPVPTGDRERRMLRMSALRAAAEVLHGSGVPANELTSYAETLLEWLEA